MLYSNVVTSIFRRASYYTKLQMLILAIVMSGCLCLIQIFGLSQLSRTNAVPVSGVSIKKAAPQTTATTAATQAAAQPTTSVSTPVIVKQTASAPVAVPTCSPDTAYTTPSTITPTQAGLQTIIDNPNTYAVYGNSLSQIASQVARCTPVKTSGTGGFSTPFAASTANNINWQVQYSQTGDICNVSSASIALHINQVFPAWQPTSGAPAGLTSSWQTFSSAIHAYEQGHVLLDEQGAQKMLTDLEQFPATSCETINQAVTQKAQADIAATLLANTIYDETNKFGPNL